MSIMRHFRYESDFQSFLISKLREQFPGSIILKNDASYKQGIPDLLILYGSHWAALEVKISKEASHRPNQDYYIKTMHAMSYAKFVYPENYEDILDELSYSLNA